jgi:hypothetical protein
MDQTAIDMMGDFYVCPHCEREIPVGEAHICNYQLLEVKTDKTEEVLLRIEQTLERIEKLLSRIERQM